jgi:UDP-glucose 4-epimerase
MKLASENHLQTFHKIHGLETVTLRYFNIYGPRQSSNIQTQYGGVVIPFLASALPRRGSIALFSPIV